MLFPAGMDANAVITNVEDPAGALAELLRSATWLGSGAAPSGRPVERVDRSALEPAGSPAEREADVVDEAVDLEEQVSEPSS